MADFSSSDINEAKRRVEEMRRRAKNIVDEPAEKADSNNTEPPLKNAQQNTSSQNPISSLLHSFLGNDGDDSSALILALILILSKEKADNMLILALLYILL